MKSIQSMGIALILCFSFQATANGQTNNTDKIKKHINNVVQKVEQEDNLHEKRVILNESFNKMIEAFDRVSAMNIASKDTEAIALMKENILEKQDELNGNNGYQRVADRDINDFAQYVQDDFEQADRTIVIGLSTAVLIAIILLIL